MREVDIQELARARAAGAFVVDVREPGEYEAGHVPGARLIPLHRLQERVVEIPKDRPIYVVCASGNRSDTATSWLTRAGVDAYSVAGGTGAWIQAGHPVVRGPREDTA